MYAIIEVMTKPYSVLMGKAVRHISRMRGGGSALPGLFVEKIDKHFVRDTLAQLPMGIVLISGTNGKTTTTKMVVELLEGQGLKVFTNKTGSNFSRGVAAALLGEVNHRGKLHADIAVLELDEAHAVHFVQTIPPRYSLLLNVMRDQLDRFGEIDTTAAMLSKIAHATTQTVVINREDPRLAKIGESLSSNVVYFGLANSIKSTFPSDDALHDNSIERPKKSKADVVLTSVGEIATFKIQDTSIETPLKLRGVYNIFNAAAALTTVRSILGDRLDQVQLIKTLSSVTPAFGRGEQLRIDGNPCELILVKNPSGFRLSLSSFDPNNTATMIAINDNYADGRDMSWLWDVDFESLQQTGVSCVGGLRAYDMTLRLQHDNVTVDHTDINVAKCLDTFIKNNHQLPKRIYCTYTAMLAIRQALSKYTKVEDVR
ncbi:DUF1727 domain-containing protein [Candidatus Saccharibacteria bacterium]|nr:DUF1727 domain-containing protein [Candidatus Saccharibacteria bacterium]